MSHSSVERKGDPQRSERGSLGKEDDKGLFGSILCNSKAISKASEMSVCSLATSLLLLGLKGVPLIKLYYRSFDARSERFSFVVDESEELFCISQKKEVKNSFPVHR